MPTDGLILFGAGGHGLVVLDAVLASNGVALDLIVADSNPKLHGSSFYGHLVVAHTELSDLAPRFFHVSIGSNEARRLVYQDLSALGHQATTIMHPSAVVSASARIGSGCFIAAGSVLGPGVSVGDGVIVNHGAVIDHGCRIGDFSHVAPNATLAGDVQIGSGVLVGAGAVVLPGVSVGEAAVIGAGAVVTGEVKAFMTLIGVPGRVRQRVRKP